MNSEELELSLRSEFESYLKTVLAEMRQETMEFQSKLQTQFDEAFQAFSTRFDADHKFDEAFSGSVAEHLRLARDEGAKITANAMAAAEKLDQATAPTAKYDAIRDAVNDISSKDSQSSILKSLVTHAAEFAPRGAFFIIKNEHLAGWKVFGTDTESVASTVREIHFPTSADSILGEAIRSHNTVESSSGAHSEDSAFLDPLHFGRPDRMHAIPLVARGRGVAVLYADYGDGGTGLNREALETLVRVASLTVELLAASQTAKAGDRGVAADFENAHHEIEEDVRPTVEPRFDETIRELPVETIPAAEADASGFSFSDSVAFEGGFPPQSEPVPTFDAGPVAESGFVEAAPKFGSPQVKDASAFETVETQIEAVPEVETAGGAMVFDSGGSIEPAAVSTSPFDQSAAEFEPAAMVSSGGYDRAIEPVMDAPGAPAPQARLSDRPVDLPIEVPEEERRIHNDARRFARLLVSEIKLYNEKKVQEGRQAHDLYDRLREAIDRSREMYDKRVQPPVAAKFDYFHYELVNALADGNAERLGADYPGTSV